MENYFRILTDIKNAVSSDDVKTFKTLSNLLNHVNSYENCETIWNYQQNAYEKLGEVNLVCLACKSSSEEVLEYLLTSENFIFNLPYAILKSSLSPEIEDDECHNAFYYAIRSNASNLVEILIEKWPNDAFKGNFNRLDNILATAYKDLFVRDVNISKDIKEYIENRLLDLRFYDDTPSQSKVAAIPLGIKDLKHLTRLRIDFVLENIDRVIKQFQESEADELILLSLKYIVKNIYMLKMVIVSPKKLPWEEMEFCLVIFVRSFSNRFEKDPLYHFVLNKKRIATHLEKFSNILIAVKEKLETAHANKIQKLVIKEISIDKLTSCWQELFDDFTLLRDLYSLQNIKNSIDLAMSADAARKDDQLVITRALQVIGEHLKNTKAIPKLSDATNNRLHSALPPDLKKIITELRDCLSHAESLCFRSDIEESGQNFFTSMQSDINQMNLVVNEMIRTKKAVIVGMVLSKLIDCKDFSSMKLYLEENYISPFSLKKELKESENFNMGTIEQLEKLVLDLQGESERELSHAKNLYRRIHDIIRETGQSASYVFKSMTLPTATEKIIQISKELTLVKESSFDESKNWSKTQEFTYDKIYKYLQDELQTKKLEITKSALLTLKTFPGSSKIEKLLLVLKRLEDKYRITRENVEECESLISHQEELIDNTTSLRNEKFQLILSMIHREKSKLKLFQKKYRKALREFVSIISDNEERIDTSVNHDLLQFLNVNSETEIFFRHAQTFLEIFHYQLMNEKFPKGIQFIKAMKILYRFLEFRMGKIKWIKEFKQILKRSPKPQLLNKLNPEEISKFNDGLKDQLSMKCRSLRNFLNEYSLEPASSETIQISQKNAKMRSTLEMLMLDVTECLSKRFTHNTFFLDDDYPLINGRNFRNHLAHGNALVDILFGDNFRNLLLNAGKMVNGNFLESERYIGKKMKNDPKKSMDSHLRDLIAVKEQLRLFAALSAGNVEKVEDCMRKGADLKGRSLDLWTSLHFAAKGPNLKLVKSALKCYPDVKVTNSKLQTALHIASANGMLDTVQYLVEEMKMEINFRDSEGKTALHLASQKGHQNIVAFLLKHEASTTSRDIFGYAPVHYATEENHFETVAILLEKEPSVEENQTFYGLSALHVAAKNGHLNLVATLIERKENTRFMSDVHFAALHYATIGGHDEVVKYLIEKGAYVNSKNSDGLTSLHLAAVKGRDEIAGILLKQGADVNAGYLKVWTPLSIAAKRGDLQMLKLLLENGADVNVSIDSGYTPLELAAQYGHYEIVKAMLCKYSIHLKIAALHKAAFKGHKRIVELLVKNGVDITHTSPYEKKITALHFAALFGHADVVEFLIANGCDINAISECEEKDSSSLKQILIDSSKDVGPDFSGLSKYFSEFKTYHGETALHFSSRAGHRDVVRCLIKNKADILIKNASSFTPLQWMTTGGMTDILIEEKVPVSNCDLDEYYPFHIGAAKNDLKFVEYCLRNGCDINARSQIFGFTALHAAVAYGHTEMVKYLLDNGADINPKNKFNQSVLDTAVHFNRKEVLCILVKRNLRIDTKLERELLLKATKLGCEDIVEYFLSRNPKNGLADAECNEYPIHDAVKFDHRNILKLLLETGVGRGIDDLNEVGSTPLLLAIFSGYGEIVQLLLSKGADPNIPSIEGVLPLHLAITERSIEMVKMLIKAKANVYLHGSSGCSAIGVAIISKNFGILKILLETKRSSEFHKNFKGQEEGKLLRKAAILGDLQIVKYLVEKGANIYDDDYLAPMHAAAMSGHQHIIEYFVSLGLSLSKRIKQSNLVHYAALGNQSEICEFLCKKGLDFNARDEEGCTPLSDAIANENVDVFHALLHFGAYYNTNYDPLNVDHFRNCIKCDELSLDYFLMRVSLTLIAELFLSVRKNDISKTEVLLNTALKFSKFGYANVRNSKNISLLHYAAWKGHEDIVDILLKFKANPNATNWVSSDGKMKKGGSALHYAAKYSHPRIVKSLLGHGAIFNAVCDSGKTPLVYAKNHEIMNILKYLKIIFKKIRNEKAVFLTLSRIEVSVTRRAVVRAKNIDGRTFTTLAIATNHPEAKNLKSLFQPELSTSLKKANELFYSKQLEESVKLYQVVLQERINLFGPDDLAFSDIQLELGIVFSAQKNFTEALNLAENVYKNRKEILGETHLDTLIAKRHISDILGSQGSKTQALNMCEEVLKELIKSLGLNHDEIVLTQLRIADFLLVDGKLKAAFDLHALILENLNQCSMDASFQIKAAIALNLSRLGKHHEALQMLRHIYEQNKKMFGPLHSESINTLKHIALVLCNMDNEEEGLKTLKMVLKYQKRIFGTHHVEIFHTQDFIADELCYQKKFDEAVEIYKTNIEIITTLFGADDPQIQEIKGKIDDILVEHQLMPQSTFFKNEILCADIF